MSNQHTAFVGSVPENYDKYMSPIFFDPYAADMVNRLPTPEPKSVLELAFGTGILTRVLARLLPQRVTLVATDVSLDLIEFAAAQGTVERVVWGEVDATALPFPALTFDAVICQFGVMFFPDKLAA